MRGSRGGVGDLDPPVKFKFLKITKNMPQTPHPLQTEITVRSPWKKILDLCMHLHVHVYV